METTERRRTNILIGLGLVLMGLLSGILLMLSLQDEAPVPQPRAIDRIELGNGDRVTTATAPSDSGTRTSTSTVPPPAALNNLFREVASQVTPAVVFIQVENTASLSDRFQEFDERMPDRFFRSPVPRRSVGSGVIISDQGHIVTNHHVVDGGDNIQVTLDDKRQYQAKVVGTDASTDLAVLKVDATADLPGIAFGDSDSVEVGEWVIAVGNPFRLTSTVTAGIVSALGRQVNIIEDAFRIEDFIQTDAAINPGNSGGALVNMQGELVGISTAIATESGSYEGYGFAVPSNLMQRVVRDLIARGDVQRGFLGVTIQEIDADAASELGLSEIRGVYIGDVYPDGAAAQAGIRDGDVVLTVNGRDVDAPNELQSLVARNRPGDALTVRVLRDRTERVFTVTLMGRQNWAEDTPAQRAPPEEAPPPQDPSPSGAQLFELEAWGLGIRAVTARERNDFGVGSGVYVAYVQNGSAVANGGLPRDVVVTRVDEALVRSVEDVLAALERAEKSGAPVLVQVQRRDETSAFYEVQPPDTP